MGGMKKTYDIGWIQPHLAVCGGIRRFIEFANRLVERGHSVNCYLPDWVVETKQTGGWMGQGFSILRMSDLKKVEHDIVLFNEETQYVEAHRSKAKKKVFYALHYPLLHKDLNVLRECYHGGFDIICNSTWTQNCLLAETGRKYPVVLGGLNHSMFNDSGPVDPYSSDIMYYGATRGWKGGPMAEEIIKMVDDKWMEHEDYHLVVNKMGDSNLKNQDKLSLAYRGAKVYLSTSIYEGWNWPCLEAMACGAAVIKTKDGGSADYAKHGKNCLEFDPYDVRKAADSVYSVLRDGALRRQMTTEGLRTAQEYDWDDATDIMEKTLGEIFNA